MPTQTLWSRDQKARFRLKIEKPKRFAVFDPNRGGLIFLTLSPTPPAPLPLGHVSTRQNNDSTRGLINNSTPWGRVRESAPKGGYVAFSHICGPAWFCSNDLCKVIAIFQPTCVGLKAAKSSLVGPHRGGQSWKHGHKTWDRRDWLGGRYRIENSVGHGSGSTHIAG